VACIQRTLPEKLQKSPLRKINILVKIRFFTISSPFSVRFFPKCCLATQPPTVYPKREPVGRLCEKQNLARNLNANFGAKNSTLTISGFRSPIFTKFCHSTQFGDLYKAQESTFDYLKPFKSYSRKTISGNCENRIFAFKISLFSHAGKSQRSCTPCIVPPLNLRPTAKFKENSLQRFRAARVGSDPQK
jgi:hypothetical protein